MRLSHDAPGRHDRARQRHVPALDGLRARGPRRDAPLPGPADRRRPDLPRDPLRAAAADAGQGARDRAGHRARRRQPAARAGQRDAQARRGGRSRCSCARPSSTRPTASATSASCSSRATASARRASGPTRMQRATAAIAAAPDREAIALTLIEQLTAVFGAGRAGVTVQDPDTGDVAVIAEAGAPLPGDLAPLTGARLRRGRARRARRARARAAPAGRQRLDRLRRAARDRRRSSAR